MEQKIIDYIINFYSTTDNNYRIDLEKNLNKFQNSDEMWIISKKILELNRKDDSFVNFVLPFVLMSMSKKIIKNFHMFEKNFSEDLIHFKYNLLFNFYITFGLNKLINKKYELLETLICRNISNIYLLCLNDFDIIKNIIEKLKNKPEILFKMLNEIILTYNELKNKYNYVISNEVFTHLKDIFIKNANSVNFIVKEYLNNINNFQNKVMRERCLNCLYYWSECTNIPLNYSIFNDSKLFDLIFNCFLNNPNLNEYFNSLYILLNLFNKSYGKYNDIEEKILVFASKINFNPFDYLNNDKSLDFSKVQSFEKFCSLIIIFCKIFHESLLELNEKTLFLLKNLLNTFQIKFRKSNLDAFDYLILYLREISYVYKSIDDINHKNKIKSVVIELVKIINQLCVIIDTDCEDEDYNDEFIELRELSTDFFNNASVVLGKDEFLRSTILSDQTYKFICSNIKTRTFESSFNTLSSIILKDINQENFNKIENLLLLAINSDCNEFEEMGIFISSIIVNLGKRINSSVNFKIILKYIFHSIQSIPNLKNNILKKRISLAISNAFEKICLIFPLNLQKELSSIIQLFGHFNLFERNEHKKRFINGICILISKISDLSILREMMNHIVKQGIERLAEINQYEIDSVKSVFDGFSYFIYYIDLKKADQKEAIKSYFDNICLDLWKHMIEKYVKNFHNSEIMMESVLSKCCKQLIRKFPEASKKLIKPIITLFDSIISTNKISSPFIYVSGIIIETYPNEIDLLNYILKMISEIFFKEFECLDLENLNSYSIYLLEDYYRFCMKTLNNKNYLILQCNYFKQIYVYAIKYLKINNFESFETISDFLNKILKLYLKISKNNVNNMFMKTIEDQYDNFIKQIFFCIYYHEPIFMFSSFELLNSIYKININYFKSNIQTIFTSILKNIPNQTKNNFINDFLQSEDNEHKYHCVKKFNKMCQFNFCENK